MSDKEKPEQVFRGKSITVKTSEQFEFRERAGNARPLPAGRKLPPVPGCAPVEK